MWERDRENKRGRECDIYIYREREWERERVRKIKKNEKKKYYIWARFDPFQDYSFVSARWGVRMYIKEVGEANIVS